MANESPPDHMTAQSVSGMWRREMWFQAHSEVTLIGGHRFHSRKTANESSPDHMTPQSVSGMSRWEKWFPAHSEVRCSPLVPSTTTRICEMDGSSAQTQNCYSGFHPSIEKLCGDPVMCVL